MGLKQIMFETASSTADWLFPYRIIVPNVGGWDSDADQVVLGMTPDFVAWDDYGMHSRTFPPRSGGADEYAPWFQANSDDGSGVVVLVDPNLVDIVVPAHRIRTMGPGGVAVGVQYRNKLSGARSTLVTGRLPLSDGVI
jgi:hypothetical protein